MLVRIAAAETGFARAALLDAAPSPENTVQVIAAFDPKSTDAAAQLRVSTSLAAIARSGRPAGIASRRRESHGASIAELHVTGALCLPILLAGDVVALLYLDTRDDEPVARPHATDAAAALATAYALASANLKRLDLERRHQRLRADLNAAREAQQLLFPADAGVVGCARYALHLRPGDFIAGDLFDAVALPSGHAAFIVGDVTGHGLGPGLIMATAQATLRAALRADPDPERAANTLNEDLAARLTAGRFVSLWLGILAPDGALTFVDAGHGHALIHASDRDPRALPDPGDIPIGINPDHRFTAATIHLDRDEAVVLYSDGVTEQRNAAGLEFGAETLRHTLRGTHPDPREIVRIIADALEQHAPGTRDDDATIAAIARSSH
jgi:serine phosphatase RsbU (regulator of sigma subunit)